jgi:hypothetical protein
LAEKLRRMLRKIDASLQIIRERPPGFDFKIRGTAERGPPLN